MMLYSTHTWDLVQAFESASSKNNTCYRIISEATQKSVTDIASHVSSFDQNRTKPKTWNKKVLIVTPSFLPKMS